MRVIFNMRTDDEKEAALFAASICAWLLGEPVSESPVTLWGSVESVMVDDSE